MPGSRSARAKMAWALALLAPLGCRVDPSLTPAPSVDRPPAIQRRLAMTSALVCTLGPHEGEGRGGSLRCWGPETKGEEVFGDVSAVLGHCVVAGEQLRCPSASDWAILDLPTSVRERGIAALGTMCVADRDGGHYCTAHGEARWTTPTQFEEVAEISGDANSGCVLSNEGELSCWPTTTRGDNPLEALELPLTTLAAESNSRWGCALSTEGAAWCWRSEGRESQATSPQPLAEMGSVRGLSASSRLGCASFDDGRVSCWNMPGLQCSTGLAAELVGAPVSGLPPALEVRAGEDAACVVTKTGELWCWGDIAAWGVDDPSFRASPREVDGITEARALALGPTQSCALLDSGEVYCWGRWLGGLVGPKPRCLDPRPRRVADIEHGRALALGPRLGCVLDRDSSLVCWGPSPGDLWRSRSAVKIAGPDARTPTPKDLALVWDQVCTIRNDAVHCWSIAEPDEDTKVFVEALDWTPLPGSRHDPVIALAALDDRICGWSQTGAAYCWTQDGARTLPERRPEFDGARAIAGSPDFECGLIDTQLRCRETRSSSMVSVEGFANARGLAVGATQACTIDDGGDVDCRGLPHGSSRHLSLPLERPTISLGFGARHACALAEDGRVRCWGEGADGQLGNALLPNWSRPVRVTVGTNRSSEQPASALASLQVRPGPGSTE